MTMQTQKFDKPLDQWIEEPVKVATVEAVTDKQGKAVGLKHGEREVIQKTIYTELSAPQTIDCGIRKHYWYIPDKHNHIAYCKNCVKRRMIRAVFEQVIEGKIINRDDKSHID